MLELKTRTMEPPPTRFTGCSVTMCVGVPEEEAWLEAGCNILLGKNTFIAAMKAQDVSAYLQSLLWSRVYGRCEHGK